MTISEPIISSRLDAERQRILEHWRTISEEEKRKFVALDKAWAKVKWVYNDTKEQEEIKKELHFLVELGRDWCEENGFEREDFDCMFAKE